MLRPKGLCACISVLAIAGCGVLPASGPYSQDVFKKATISVKAEPAESLENPSFQYALVNITKPILDLLEGTRLNEEKLSYNWPSPTEPEVIAVNPGDVISITIYEARSGGLFIPTEAGVRPGNFVTLPNQTVDKTGYISVPYVGLVRAAGRSPNTIGEAIAKGLRERAVEPQVVVSFVQRNGAEVSILGQVNEAKRYSLSFEGDKILDAIAVAGGPNVPGHEALVTLQRKGSEFSIPFDILLLEPKKNVYLQAKDTIYVYREPKTFSIYGAAQIKGIYPFDKREVTLSEAIAKASGLNDDKADPAEIYVYRHKNPKSIYSYSQNEPAQNLVQSSDLPVIYRLNLRDPKGFFMAQKFVVKNEDIIYIANAESVEFIKFLNLVNSTATTSDNVNNTYFGGKP